MRHQPRQCLHPSRDTVSIVFRNINGFKKDHRGDPMLLDLYISASSEDYKHSNLAAVDPCTCCGGNTAG